MFDHDPFLLFRLRGMQQGALMDRIGGGDVTFADTDATGVAPADGSSPATVPLQTKGFWDMPNLPDGLYGSVETPSAHAALPKQLGKFPFWRAEEELVAPLEPVYEAASGEGVKAFEKNEAFAESS